MSQHVLGGVRSQPDQLGASGEEPQGLADDQSDDTDAYGMMSIRGCPHITSAAGMYEKCFFLECIVRGGQPNADEG